MSRRRRVSEPSARPYMPGGEPPSGDLGRTHVSDFRIRAGDDTINY